MRTLLAWISAIFGLLMVLALDAGFLPGLGEFWSRMNATLVIAIFLMVIFRTNLAYSFYLAATTLIAVTVSNLFLIPLVSGFVALSVLNLLLERFLTNRSYYVLIALGGIGWFLYHSIYAIMLTIYGFWSPEAHIAKISIEWFIDISLLSFIVLLVFSAAYIATSFMSKRFRSYFIISEN